MQLHRTLDFGAGLSATVKELTVVEVRQWLADGGEGSMEAILRASPESIQVTDGLDETRLGEVWDALLSLNAALFRAKGDGKPLSKLGLARMAQNIDKTCLALIERGHLHIYSYPYRLYLLAIQRAEKKG
jgi:hypothetical protein